MTVIQTLSKVMVVFLPLPTESSAVLDRTEYKNVAKCFADKCGTFRCAVPYCVRFCRTFSEGFA
jgi:hypothetical protein